VIKPEGNMEIHWPRLGSIQEKTIAFALSALVLYVPANIFPFMAMNLYGRKTESTLWQGVVQLYSEGSWLIAFIILAASIVVPLFKIVVLLFLAPLATVPGRFQWAKAARVLEVIGKWAMLDVFVVAVLISIIKLGSWADVSAGPGLIAFCGVVLFTMLASSTFESQFHEKV
jgi:paraquat-inducible protein A